MENEEFVKRLRERADFIENEGYVTVGRYLRDAADIIEIPARVHESDVAGKIIPDQHDYANILLEYWRK